MPADADAGGNEIFTAGASLGICQRDQASRRHAASRERGCARSTQPGFGDVTQEIGLANAQFFVLAAIRNLILASGRTPSRRDRFGSSQKPGCGADRSVAAPREDRLKTRRSAMQKGTVKWFNPTKGYGFIQPSTGDKDVFVHISAVERAGLGTLNEGQVVEYEVVSNRGKTSAENLKVS
jgi:CspA family cold shock protein